MMKFWITEPHAASGPLQDALRARWLALKGPAKLTFMQANPGEIHGELLTRIWTYILEADEHEKRFKGLPTDLHVISETDFILQDAASQVLLDDYLTTTKALFVPNLTRDKETLELQHHFPLSAPWLLGINKNLFDIHNVKPDWLGASGPLNDAANFAFFNSLDNLTDGDFHILTAHDARSDGILGVHYPHFGRHCFWNREFNSPPDKILLGDWTVGRHTAGIKHLLEVNPC